MIYVIRYVSVSTVEKSPVSGYNKYFSENCTVPLPQLPVFMLCVKKALLTFTYIWTWNFLQNNLREADLKLRCG